ncbi:MAG TPA: hypothetical protein VGG88_12865 [Gaiellaceae bacterium]|jgi:hypothetical protein
MHRGVVVASALAACALAAGAGSASAQTCPHPGTVNGISVLIYCGSAKATVKMGSQTFKLKNGQCKKAAGNFYLSFGDVVTQQVKKAPDSFLVIATATKDGTYSGTTVMATRSGHGWLADSAKLTLTHATKAGTVAGTLESTQTNAKVALHLTFSC